MSAVANDLQSGFEILWYQIESVLGRGGFGITYLARDNNLGQLVAIKEYLPHDFATRSGDSTVQPVSVEQNDVFSWGLERFMSEAQTLAKFKHPNVVRVLSVFKHNNTGYMVMEYEEGEDLSDVYKRKKKLTQRELEDIYYPVIDGLSSVHKEGFIHRDIKPSNLYIRTDGSPVLIDFGAARQAVGSKTKTLTSMLSIGYAPFEQYNDEPGKQGPWTDIYALGASLHQGITGEKPMESTIRGMALLHDEPDPYEPLSQSRIEGYSHAFLRAIDQALMLQIYDRPQTLEDFLGMLKGEIALPDLPDKNEKVTESTVVRDKTVVRPGKRKFSGAEVEVTHLDQPAPNEKAATREKEPSGIATTEEIKQPPDKPRLNRKSLITRPTFLIGMAVVVAIIVAFVAYYPGEPSPEEHQQQRVNDLLKKAGELIAGGNYYDASSTSAFSVYQQVLAIEPDNPAAKNGIDNVGQHYLLQAEQFIDIKDFGQADASLKIVNAINPEFPGLKETVGRFSENLDNEKKFKQIELYNSLANSALEKGQIYKPEQKSAFFYYQNVLKLDPENVTANLGVFKIADRLIAQAQTAIKKNDTKRATTLVNLAESINPDNPAIQTLRQQISQTGDLKKILVRADSAYAKNRYTSPRNDNAYDLYRQVLSIEPSNQQAQKRLNQIADYYANKTQSATRSGNIATANTNLGILQKFFPDYSVISNLKRGISDKQNEIKKQAEIKRQNEIEKQAEIKRQNEIKKQAEIKRQNEIAALKKSEIKLPTINKLLPTGINQKQDDYQVVQDIVGTFINAFKNRDMNGLLEVAQLTNQQRGLYAKIFGLYQSVNIKVAPNSFTLNKKDGVARVQFEIIDLVDTNGNQVVTSANWTKIELNIAKMNGSWLKAAII